MRAERMQRAVAAVRRGRCLVVALLMVAACGAEPPPPVPVEGPRTWGSLRAMGVDDIWIAGQPDAEALRAAKQDGVALVINLRGPEESDFDERAAAEALGLVYRQIPVDGTQPFARETFDRIDRTVAEHGGQAVLVHCASGNRAAGWLATHLVREGGMSIDDALAVGRAAGLTKSALETRVREFLTP